MPINLPYPVLITVYDTDGATAVSSVRVRARNETTNEVYSDTVTTNSSGQAVLDFANFTKGYTNQDTVTLYVIYNNADGKDSIIIADEDHDSTITLVSVTDLDTVTYTTTQNVWDMLDGITATELPGSRIVKFILRAEAEIDSHSGTKFKPTRVDDEVYDYNQYTAYESPESLAGYLGPVRTDNWNTFTPDKLRLRKYPIIVAATQLNGALTSTGATATVDSTTNFPSSGRLAIESELMDYTGKTSTTFTGLTRGVGGTTGAAHSDNKYVTMHMMSTNSAGVTSADSWTVRDPQVGGGGDYLLSNQGDTGHIEFIQNKPRYGKRAFKITYTYGYVTVPKTVERLATLLALRDALNARSAFNQLTSDSISLGDVNLSGGTGSIGFLKQINNEIEMLWNKIQVFKTELV